ncbi:MAG: hypothetical protein AMK72_13070 [Planctomycetes bacterium SM23_25]|nr:MAG: hypothetical protein AMK72_13070 [Planctomycetes bacterium SM23_25]
MKRLCLILAGLLLVSMVAAGCQPTSHGRYRQMTYRRVIDADILGFEDDVDAAILLSERPTHLSQWYHQ